MIKETHENLYKLKKLLPVDIMTEKNAKTSLHNQDQIARNPKGHKGLIFL